MADGQLCRDMIAKRAHLLRLQLLQFDSPLMYQRLELVRLIYRRLIYSIYPSASLSTLATKQHTIYILHLGLDLWKLFSISSEPPDVCLADKVP